MRKPVLLVYRDEQDAEPYEQALAAAGLNRELRPANEGLSMGDCAGLVLSGGTDVDPSLYGEERHGETEPPDPERDAVEMLLLREALERDLPILAICRGLQILNVFQGGSLIQHLVPPERHRKKTPDRAVPAHEVVVDPDTLLFAATGRSKTLQVNSRHHQAIRRLGAGLKVSASDPSDGVIEAVEFPGKRFVLAVQWHPENQVFQDEQQLRIFQSYGAALA